MTKKNMKCKTMGMPYYGAADAFALMTPYLILFAWLDGPNTVSGYMVGMDGERGSTFDRLGGITYGREALAEFVFAGTKAQLTRLMRVRIGCDALDDPRIVINPTARMRKVVNGTDPGEFGVLRSPPDQTDFSRFHRGGDRRRVAATTTKE